MKYLITDTSVIRISETYGTIQNVSNSKIELSNKEDFSERYLLQPQNKVSFSGKLYVRAYNKVNGAIEFNVATFIAENGVANPQNTNVDDMLDSIFGGGSDTVPDDDVTSDEDANDYLDSIFGGNSDDVSTEDVANDNDVDDYLDSIFGGL